MVTLRVHPNPWWRRSVRCFATARGASRAIHYAWDFDLCSLHRRNFNNYPENVLVRDYGALLDDGLASEASYASLARSTSAGR